MDVQCGTTQNFSQPYPKLLTQSAVISGTQNMLQTIYLTQETFHFSFYFAGSRNGSNDIEISLTSPDGSNYVMTILRYSSIIWSSFQGQFIIPSAGFYTINFKGQGTNNNGGAMAITGVMINHQ